MISSVLKCMCSTHSPTLHTHRTGKCDPFHFSHRGNVAADGEAELGRLSAVLDDAEQPLELGECRCVLADPEGVRADLPMAAVLCNSVTQHLLVSAAHRSSRAAVLELARSVSDPAFLRRAALKAVSASSQVSSRFLVRLWCSALPTYRLLSKRIAEDGESHTAVMYTPDGSD